MTKRKRSNSTERLLKKLKKIERKIERRQREEESTSRSASPPPGSPEREPSIVIVDEVVPDLHQKDPDNQPITEEQEFPISESILKVLGNHSEKPQEWGKKIHNQIAERWENIIINGMDKTEKTDILKQIAHLPPENCPHLITPKLNPETAAACSELCKKKDGFIENRQRMLSASIAGLATAVELTLNAVEPDTVKIQLIEILNNSAKILGDIFHNENKTRRSLILSGLQKDIKDALAETKPERFLFGENLYEKIKTAKSMGKTGREIRIQHKVYPTTASNKNQASNWKGPPRQTQKQTQQEPRVIKNRSSGPRPAPQKRPVPATSRGYRKQNSSSNQHHHRN